MRKRDARRIRCGILSARLARGWARPGSVIELSPDAPELTQRAFAREIGRTR